ncbi:MAG: tetratricopeptide repeat protein [Bacteroidia bacterium]|jgi:predicted CXXCH cytochrome family protein|nr:tetratricopeptide repeat protein [Bacteroidia bacterium]
MVKNKIRFSVCFSVALLFLFFSCENQAPSSQLPLNDSLQNQTVFVGSAACKQCHTSEYMDWLSSDHYLAMQEVNDSTVLGRLNSGPFKLDGVMNQVLVKDHQYLLKTNEIDGAQTTYTLSYTFGYFPLQQYLVKTEKGQLQATRLSWDSRNQKWFHQYAGQKIHPSDWLHWTGNSQNWNTMCASCHSTNFKKNYDFESDTYASTYSEINVACESCHGAGSTHVSFIQSEAYQKGERLHHSGLHYGKDKNNRLQLNTCTPCHARKTDLSAELLHSEELLDNFIPEVISNEHYFADGQINNEDYEYGSFAQSKMFHNKVKCSDCHNPHSGKLKKEGNAMCLSCHEPKYDTEQHHFHKGKGESTQCINCHMPQKTYMGNDHRRDHSFRIPRPDQSLIYKTPNTCNSCHNKQSASWAAGNIKKWYGSKRVYHFSDDLLPGSLLDTKSEVHLIKLLADTAQPEIARATAIYYLGKVPGPKGAQALLKSIEDPFAMLRYRALRALENFPAEVWSTHAAKCLNDKVRAVRIAAADLYHRYGKEVLPNEYGAAFASANAENKAYLHYNRDFALGAVMAGDFDLQNEDYLGAVKHYIRGLKKDSLMNYARLNLSAAYNAAGKNTEALNTLTQALVADPNNSRAHYNLALLYNELKNPQLSAIHFEKAEKLGDHEADLYYNYGLLLWQMGQSKKSENVLLKGCAMHPASSKLNYALAYFYLQSGDVSSALKYAELLYRLDPNNSNYRELYKKLHIF